MSLFSLQAFNEFQTTQLLNIEGSTHLSGSVATVTLLSGTKGSELDAQYGFPWDVYHLTTVFIVINHENNTTLPILKLAPVDSANDFFQISQILQQQATLTGQLILQAKLSA